MEIKVVTDKKIWDEFVSKHGPKSGSFLHSLDWIQFQGGKAIGMYQKDKLEAVAHLIEKKLPAGKKYFYCPRGPVSSSLWYIGDLVRVLADQYAQKHGAMFIRFDSTIEGSGKMSDKKIRPVASVQPKHTLLLDLEKDPERLLAEMHHKTRYNIRLAERKGVKVEILGVDRFDQVWPIFEQTAERDQFGLHDKEYYQNMLGSNLKLIVARFENEIIATTIMVDFAGVRTYLHGASSNKHRNLMAAYAIQWQQIQGAKEQGLKYYDFWGVSDINKQWKGITRFKRGFKGFEIEYAGTFDYVLNSTEYFLYQFARKLRYGK